MSAPRNAGTLLAEDPAAPSSSADVPFRDIIPDPAHPKVAGISAHTAQSWTSSREAIPAAAWLAERLRAHNLERPFVGITTHGHAEPAAYALPGAGAGDAAATRAMAAAARALVAALTPAERAAALHASVDQDDMRLWSNPELYVNRGGVRLDEAGAEARAATHALLRASFSPAGYEKVRGCCAANGFLGRLVGGRGVLNEHSYNLRLFGAVPGAGGEDQDEASGDEAADPERAWAYTFFGHHLCLCVLVLGPHVVVAPAFLGAEPDRIDEGPDAGLRLFRDEELRGLALQQALPAPLQARAVVASQLAPHDPLPEGGRALPDDRWNPFDERHLGGARQDNRVVPLEGLCVADMPPRAQDMVVGVWRAFNELYTPKLLAAREAEFRARLAETYWAWIGGWGDSDAFYYRLYGPNTLCELDFHCGIFLTNTRPARCHVHTINRLPNAGDYGAALMRAARKAKAEREAGK